MSLDHVTRRVTVIFEGEDSHGERFTFKREVSATKGGDNPRFYGQQVAEAAAGAAESIRTSVEALYGQPPA